MKILNCKICPIVLLIIFTNLRETDCVQVISMSVPPRVKMGDKITLSCFFDLQKESLYSLNWWKDNEQFYQYSPAAEKTQIIYETPGVVVDGSNSNVRDIVLLNATNETAGEYKCEIVSDFPSYHRDHLTSLMEVIEVPKYPPQVHVNRVHYRVGDLMEANCSSERTNPPPSLFWSINGREIPPRNTRYPAYPTVRNLAFHNSTRTQDFMTSIVLSEVFLIMKQIHFMHGGRAILSCEAVIPDVYSRVASVQLTLPGIKPIEPSQHISNGQPKSILCFTILVMTIDLHLWLLSLINS